MSKKRIQRIRPRIYTCKGKNNPTETSPENRKNLENHAEKEEINNVRRGILLGIGGVAALGGIFGVRKLFENKHNDRVDTEYEVEENGPASLEIVMENNVGIPSYLIEQDTAVNYEKPSTLDMTDEEFYRLSLKFAEQIITIAKKYKAMADKNPSAYPSMMNGFLQEAQNVVMLGDSRITDDFKRFSRTTSQMEKKESFPLIMDRVNQYLIPSGLYIFLNFNTVDRIPMLNVYAIEKSGNVKITDKRGEEKMPYLLLKDPQLPPHRTSLGGTVDGVRKRVLIFKEQLADTIDEFIRAAGTTGGEVEKRDITDNSLRHESTHLFLTRRFPKSAVDIEKKFPYKIACNINGEKKNLQEAAHVYSAHEVCGLGAQLMNAGTKTELLAYLTLKSADNYDLALRLIKFALMQVAEGLPLVNGVVEGYRKTGKIDTEALRTVVKSSDFKIEDVRKVGLILYNLGYGYFMSAEKSL